MPALRQKRDYMNNFDSRALRDTLGCFATGVTIVTTSQGDNCYGMTVNSFSSVSLNPPLVLWNLAVDANSYDAFSSTEFYNVHILGDDQRELSDTFAQATDSDKFDGLDYQIDQRGVPRINGCKAIIHCRLDARHQGGDHLILVGQVLELTGDSGVTPLIFSQGQYAQLLTSLG